MPEGICRCNCQENHPHTEAICSEQFEVWVPIRLTEDRMGTPVCHACAEALLGEAASGAA